MLAASPPGRNNLPLSDEGVMLSLRRILRGADLHCGGTVAMRPRSLRLRSGQALRDGSPWMTPSGDLFQTSPPMHTRPAHITKVYVHDVLHRTATSFWVQLKVDSKRSNN